MSALAASDAALATAEWWAERVFGGSVGSSGDGLTDMMAIVAGAQGVEAASGKRGEFTAALAARVDSSLDRSGDRFGVTLSVDYGPEPPLSDIAQQVGVSSGSFPWKTMTWTYPTHLVTSAGYGGRSVLAWHAADWERPICGQGKWGVNSREPWKCSDLQYHEGDHKFDTPEPLCRGVYLGKPCLKPRISEAHDLKDEYYSRFAHEFAEVSA